MSLAKKSFVFDNWKVNLCFVCDSPGFHIFQKKRRTVFHFGISRLPLSELRVRLTFEDMNDIPFCTFESQS
jgi:hypothetical protein